MPFSLGASLAIALVCVVASAVFSGLTLGLLSLDLVGLQIISQGDDPREREYAKTIIPLRSKGNQLLCTLLIGNTLANSFLSILLADLTSGPVGLMISTALIVLICEIIPQSICTRHGLYVGARTVWITQFFMTLFFIVAAPLAYLLDKALGHEMGTVYTRSELKHLIAHHVQDPEAAVESGLTQEDHRLLSGALDYQNKAVRDVMTPVERVFMLDASVRLNFEHMLEVYKSGYTRIPVYEGSRSNIIGILYTKDLILVDPDDELEVRTVISFHGKAQLRCILDSTPLNEVFKLFKTSLSHLMVAVRLTGPPPGSFTAGAGGGRAWSVSSQQRFLPEAQHEVTGIITLEDVLEEVIQDEIIDESDNYTSNDHSKRVIRKERDRPDFVSFLQLFEHKKRHEALSLPEVKAVAAFLTATVKEFSAFANADAVLKGLIRQSEVLETSDDGGGSPHSTRNSSGIEATEELEEAGTALYSRGIRSGHFTLVLQGKVVVRAGSEEFQSELGPWSVMGNHALTATQAAPYVPDFSAVTAGACRVLRIRVEDYQTALRVGQAELLASNRTIKEALSSSRPDLTRISLASSRPDADSPLQSAAAVWSHANRTSPPAGAGAGLSGGSPGTQLRPPSREGLKRSPVSQVAANGMAGLLRGRRDGYRPLGLPPAARPSSAGCTQGNGLSEQRTARDVEITVLSGAESEVMSVGSADLEGRRTHEWVRASPGSDSGVSDVPLLAYGQGSTTLLMRADSC